MKEINLTIRNSK